MQNEDIKHKHPAFGQIRFSRITGGGTHFYGSELKQDNYIEMTVQKSEIIRDLTQDRFYGYGAPLIRIRMSANQFSELITSMNNGSGPCCTIEMVDGKPMEKLPDIESRKEFVHNSFKERMNDFAKTIKEHQQLAMTLVKKKTLTKDDVRDLTNHLEWLTTEVTKNIPFFAECFQETMDTVVQEAKLEVENAIQHKINVLGLDQLHKQNKLLSEGNTEEIEIN